MVLAGFGTSRHSVAIFPKHTGRLPDAQLPGSNTYSLAVSRESSRSRKFVKVRRFRWDSQYTGGLCLAQHEFFLGFSLNDGVRCEL